MIDSKISVKESLRMHDIKIMELSKMLDVSRPTLYKMIELYDSNELEKIPVHIISLFKYLQNPYINKNNILSYIVTNIISIKNAELDSKDDVNKDSISHKSLKESFIAMILSSNRYDRILELLLEYEAKIKAKQSLPTQQITLDFSNTNEIKVMED